MIGANTYDIAQFRRASKAKPARSNLLHQEDALVSVVIPAHNESLVIKRTLDSVRKSTYPNLEVLS